MSSILNSISSGNLQVQQVPGEIPVKEDSIIDLLQNSEIEFKPCHHAPDRLEGVNTGFGEGQELHYDTPCHKQELKIPLYKNNYLREFVTEEEKAAVRNSLGLYTKGDVVTTALLTTTTDPLTPQELVAGTIRQFRYSDQFFAPVTLTKAVLDSSGQALENVLLGIRKELDEAKNSVETLVKKSQKEEITSLGDVRDFLSGFINGDNLHDVLDSMNEEFLRFETTGLLK